MYKALSPLIKETWNDRYKRFAIARIAKAVVYECWLYVGAETRQKCTVTLFPEKEPTAIARLVDYTPVDDVFVPVSSVGAEMAAIIPSVGPEPDEVARVVAVKLWRFWQRTHASKITYTAPALSIALRTPKVETRKTSLLDYAND